MSETALTTTPTREIVNIVDVVFDLGPDKYSFPTRARALVRLVKQIAASRIEGETDADSPWSLQTNDSEEQLALKIFMLLKETQRQAIEEIKALAFIAQQAELIAGMEFAKDEGYVAPDGSYITIEEAYASTRPDESSYASSGRERSIEAFITKGTRVLSEFGIPEERIVAMNRPGMRSNLANCYSWIGRITRMPLEREETTEALEHLVDVATSCHSSPDFQRQMRIRYEETGGEDLGRGMYAVSIAGDTVLVAMELPELLWKMIVQPRTRDVMDIAPAGAVVPPISPAQVENVLGTYREWSLNEQRLMRAAVMANPYRSICLGIMEAWPGEEVTVKSIQRVTTLTNYQIRSAMVELCTYHRDGITTFCRLSRVEGDEQYWRLAKE